MGIRARVLLPVVALTLLVAAGILISNSILFSSHVDTTVREQVEISSRVAQESLEAYKTEARIASASMAEDPEIIQALENNDREALLAHAVQTRQETNIDFYTITDAEGIVVARTHAPEVYGDSLLGQENIRSALGGIGSAAVEEGSIVQLAARSGEPIYNAQGEIIGAVSAGFRLDTADFVNKIKEITLCEVTIVLGDIRIASTIIDEESDPIIGTSAPADVVETVSRGYDYIGQVDIMGRAALSHYTPLYDTSGDVIGMIFIGQYVDVSTQTTFAFIQSGLVITLVLLILFVAIIYTVVRRVDQTITAQAALIQEEHERANLMLDANPLASRLWSRNYDLIECNAAAVRLFGMKDKQDYIDHYYDLSSEYQPDGQRARDKVRAMIDEAFETGTSAAEWEYRTRGGELVPAEVTMVRVPYGNEHVVAAYSRDLREQRKAMAEKEKVDALLRTVNHAVAVLLDTSSTSQKDVEQDLLGSLELIGKGINADRVQIWKNEDNDEGPCFTLQHEWASLIGREKTFVPIGSSVAYSRVPRWQEMFERGEYINAPLFEMSFEERQLFSTGAIQSIVVIPLFLDNEFWGLFGIHDCKQAVTFSTDAIEILRSAGLMLTSALSRSVQSTRLSDALREAERANNAKSDFLARMSHEMRTPLNAVIGLSELALNTNGLSQETAENLEKIYNSGLTLLNIINDILDISKIEAGKVELMEHVYDVPSLINDTTIQNVLRIGSKPIQFTLNIEDGVFARLYGDELRIKQIMNNLLSNAIKFTAEGTVEFNISCEREGDSVVWMTISIKDTGIGILPEDQKRLFSAYTQFNMETTHMLGGTGLGLSIARMLTELMHGEIWFESEFGVGSTFSVRIRQEYVDDAVLDSEMVESLRNFRYFATKRSKKARRQYVKLPYARVLLVDDNITNLDVARGLMKPYEMQIDSVKSGQEAVDAIKDEKVIYNAIFMDHMMPGMNGDEALVHIRELDSDYAKTVPIIALTANAIVGNEQLFLDKGFQAFIPKPIDLSLLDEVIKRFLRDKSKEEPRADEDISSAANAEDPAMRMASFFVEGVADLDIERGLHTFGDEEAFFHILESFTVNTRPLLVAMNNVNRDNLAAYAVTVHGIKSASYGICANKTGDMAKALETAAKADDLAYVLENNKSFQYAIQDLIEVIEAALDNRAEKSPRPTKEKPDEELLEKLCAACEKRDIDEAEEVLEALNAFTYESDDGLVAWLRENALQMNYSQIVERLSSRTA